MGKVIALSCMLTITLQTLIYVAGNLGYQLGAFCNLPFISEGINSIMTNMILAGMVCSAFRYDKVTKDNHWNIRKRSDSPRYL